MKLPINTIVCGDCLEVMKDWPDNCVDLVLTDPPYGLNRDKGFGGFGGFGKPIARRNYNDDWDNVRPSQTVFEKILKLSNAVILFGGNFFADILPQSTHWLVWDKLNTMPTFGDCCELIWTNINRKRKSVKKYTYEYNGLIGKERFRWHPTQKPVVLLQMIVDNYSKLNNIVLDPFCGSGTTCVAAKMLGRRFIGIDISEKYCEISRRRLKGVRPSLFEKPKKKRERESFGFDKKK